jgi:hypothetical protein
MSWTFPLDEVTKGGNYAFGTEALLTLADPEGLFETNVATSTLGVDVSLSKFIVQITVTNISVGNGGIDAKLQASMDETTWVDVDASLGLAIDTRGLNTGTAIADATTFVAPYWRLFLFTDGTDTEDDIIVTAEFVALDQLHRR